MKKKKTCGRVRFRKQTVPELFGVGQREYKGARKDTNAKDWILRSRVKLNSCTNLPGQKLTVKSKKRMSGEKE